MCEDKLQENRTDFSKLEKNICEIVKEEQIKLGYRKEKIHLYYPLKSLNRLLRKDCTVREMLSVLEQFIKQVEEKLGKIEISNEKERFCFTLPEKTAEYIHENYDENLFLTEFIQTVQKHGISIDDVKKIFLKYSKKVHMEKVTHGEFDFLIYFEDGKPDDFRYCLTDEGGHIIYHRFTVEDYEDFGFSH